VKFSFSREPLALNPFPLLYVHGLDRFIAGSYTFGGGPLWTAYFLASHPFI
jgi:hypothetical protein